MTSISIQNDGDDGRQQQQKTTATTQNLSPRYTYLVGCVRVCIPKKAARTQRDIIHNTLSEYVYVRCEFHRTLVCVFVG